MSTPSTLEVANGQVQTIADAAQLANVQQQLANNLYPTQALTNLIFVVTFISAFSYFIFSFELKNKFMLGVNKMGRWMLMIGFGAIFGSTVMARFALVIDRMSFIVNEWVQTLTQRV
jgi:aspartate ammonia-lyase